MTSRKPGPAYAGMTGFLPRLLVVGVVTMITAACASDEPEPQGSVAESVAVCEDAAVREVVEEFGRQLRAVPLLADDSILVPAMRQAYGSLVTPDLLESWVDAPQEAPGRQVSSPWPERIEVSSVTAGEAEGCVVEGDVVFVTSADAGEALREPVRLTVVETNGWRISGYSSEYSATDDSTAADGNGLTAEGGEDAEGSSAAAAVEVIRGYYADIDEGDFRGAYEAWGDGGKASGQTFEEFAAGYAETEAVSVEVGDPGRVEGAAGSRFVEIPVSITAVTASGEEQHFTGTYTLRRTVVPGASAESRTWHIYSAEVRPNS
ncbi:MAG TPA: hypothetical protein VFI91_00340 [Longimicrobiaceae bacterium]|nr:hypothetical protein [Longimicrobiaceae bacterium]